MSVLTRAENRQHRDRPNSKSTVAEVSWYYIAVAALGPGSVINYKKLEASHVIELRDVLGDLAQ